ncbi:hypothetical protein [Peterkaempfera bronchialis]|uniref:Nitroreductase domain-containing protein n=1 Tax=Peterkaempfera bronchialis TaxID=2126346 RepID=A0A345SS36_9ACTN|nr:hypothetical protein [Peterkaempfera bronchialis]AXI76541.1 hypothetical protein C7M71_002685 [Peterkaempfera bronchialis]
MAAASDDEILRFALRQGPLRGLLQDPVRIDERVRTTATLPPQGARGPLGRPLPLGTRDLLAEAGYPGGRVPAANAGPGLLGHVLTAAFGLQRREPSNPANDHRVIASVRSKFPVHVQVVGPDGAPGYLDPYRHALVDLDADPAPVAALRPPGGGVRVVLGARYTDLPTPYGILRRALADLEIGINVRSLVVAAQLFGVPATVQYGGPQVGAAGELLASSGPGSWSAPVVVTLHGLDPLPPSRPLGGPVQDRYDRGFDALLDTGSAHPSLTGSALVAEVRYTVDAAPCSPAEAIPPLPDRAGTDWSRVVWNRTAGRVPSPLTGFAVRPAATDRGRLAELLAWARVPAPEGRLRDIGSAVRLHVVVQHTAGLASGHYAVDEGALRLEQADAGLAGRLEAGFGYPLTPENDCGVRHALSLWYFTVDLERLIADFGPEAWSLLQVWCGWVTHGLTVAAAAQGLFARPARSFDEHLVSSLLRLPREQTPVFMTVCGRARYAEPMLDLRT